MDTVQPQPFSQSLLLAAAATLSAPCDIIQSRLRAHRQTFSSAARSIDRDRRITTMPCPGLAPAPARPRLRGELPMHLLMISVRFDSILLQSLHRQNQPAQAQAAASQLPPSFFPGPQSLKDQAS